jgi:hypothetical protein
MIYKSDLMAPLNYLQVGEIDSTYKRLDTRLTSSAHIKEEAKNGSNYNISVC